LLPHLRAVDVDRVESDGVSVTVSVRASAQVAACSGCGMRSSRVHGRYRRILADAPSAGRRTNLVVTVRRFKCVNDACSRSTFSEQVPGLTTPFARRTPVLTGALVPIALALVGRAGARLATMLGMPCGRDLLIGLIRAQAVPEATGVVRLGVDDFAIRRGQSYGTILIDMDTHRPVDVLPDRQADTFADWLTAHPGVEVVCRDRAGAYAGGATTGAPDAIQVADRWHLWDNLGGYVKQTVAAHHRCVKQHYAALTQTAAVDTGPELQQDAEQAAVQRAENRSRVVRARRCFEQVQALKAQGMTVTAITRELALAPMTARKYFRTADVEELVAASLAGWPSKLDDYKPHLHQRWNEGCTNITQLHREVKALGFRGGYGTVYAYLKPLKGKAAPPAIPAPPKVRHITGWIRRNPDNLDADEQIKLKEVRAACPHLDALRSHVEDFAKMMTQRRGQQDLDNWIAAAYAADLPHLHTFAGGLERDYAAVLNGLTLPYSSGAVEGAVTRAKALKRQCYGRAKFDLLRLRILLTS
jgi:transposase